MKKIPEEYFTYNLQESLVLSSKAYAEKHLLPDDMSMCFTHGFNVGRFHLRRGCRPVCARLTTPPPPFMLWFVSAGEIFQTLFSCLIRLNVIKLNSSKSETISQHLWDCEGFFF